MKKFNKYLVVLFVIFFANLRLGINIASAAGLDSGVLPSEVSCSQQFTHLPQELRAEMSRSDALEEIESIAELESSLDKVRRNNGHFVRQAKIERDRKLALLVDLLEAGELSQAANLFRHSFMKVEISYLTILSHRKFFETAHENEVPEEANAQWIRQVIKMDQELDEAYKNMGENYVEYVQARRYLEKVIHAEDSSENLKWRAEYVLSKLGALHLNNAVPALEIEEDFNPSLEEISNLFWSSTAPIIALLKKDLKHERNLRVFKYGMAGFIGLQKAVMSMGSFKIGDLQIGGPKFQAFLGKLLLISRDQYLKAEYLDNIEDLIQETRNIDARGELLLEQCDSSCEEMLETFARVGAFTTDWIKLRDHMQTKAESDGHHYKRIHKLMLEAEAAALDLKGLSVNYAQVSDGQGRQLLTSSAAVSFWTLLFTMDEGSWAGMWDTLFKFLGV